MKPDRILLKTFKDDRGSLSFCQEGEIPFSIKRIFYMYEVPAGTARGGHSHLKCHQLLIAINGSIQVDITNSIGNISRFLLNNRNEGLLIPAGFWAEQLFLEQNTICLVLASELFEEEDYIRDKNKFLRLK